MQRRPKISHARGKNLLNSRSGMLIKQRFLLFPKIADSAKILAPRWRLAAKDAGRSLARNITRLDEESARILIHVPGGWKPPLQA